MIKKTSLRLTAFVSALAVICSAAASCGDKNSSDTAQTADKVLTNVYRAEEVDADIELNYVNSISRVGDTGNILITGYDYESDTPLVYIADSELSSFEKVNINFEFGDYDNAYTNISAAPDGTLFALANLVDYGDMELPDEDDPDFDYEALEAARQESYKIFTLDLTGKILSEVDMTDIIGEYADSYIGNVTPVSADKAFVNVGDTNNILLSADGVKLAESELDKFSYVNYTSLNADGQIAITGYANGNESIQYLDPDTLAPVGELISFDGTQINNINGMFAGTGDYELYIIDSSALFGLDKDGNATEIINWLDSDISKYSITTVAALDNGDFVTYIDDYSTDTHGLFRLTKRDSSELENTKVITIGMLYDDWEVSSAISKFNKSQDAVRIKVVNYEQYDSYDDETGETLSSGIEQLKMDIISGKAPDMISVYDQMVITSLASKGVYADLYEYIDKDSDLSRDDFLENVLKASEINGKLLSLSPTFSVGTYVVKSKFFDKENWTLDDLISTYDSCPDGMRLFTYANDKESIFAMLMYSADSFVDYENGTSHFDSPEFLKLIEFANRFPDESDGIDWENATDDEMQTYWNEQETMLKDDKALMDSLYLYDLNMYANEKYGTFNDEITLVGAPSDNGQGASFNFESSFAILSTSSAKDECWSFIKQFFTEEYYEGDNSFGLPIRKDAFEKKADESMERPYWTDENGEKQYYDNEVQINGKTIKIDPLTQEERDYLVDYIKGVTKVGASYSEDIGNIVVDEVRAYFKGEKSAQEAADIIQNRVSILVSEQS